MGERGWPVRSGVFPPVADPFAAREDVPGVGPVLMSAGMVALVGGDAADAGSSGRHWPCGRTQLASQAAESLWAARAVDLLVWVSASSRASVLSGFVRAAVQLGLAYGDADLVAARLLAWLAGTRRPWLVILDDVRDGADLAGLWPAGPAGRVLVTATGPAVLAEGPEAQVVLRVPPFSLREAMGFLSARLATEDPDQRNGAIDLADAAGGEPATLAMATAVVAATGLSCRAYLDWFTQRRGDLASAGNAYSPGDVAWTLSADVAGRLIPAGGTWPLLVLASMMDAAGIPAAVFTAPATRGYLAGVHPASEPASEEVWAMLLALAHTGLLSIDQTAPEDPAVRMSRAVQQAVLAAASPRLAGRAARAAASALVQAWPDEHPHAWLASALRSSAAAVHGAAGDALWAEGCHPMLLAAGRSLEDAGMPGPAVTWWRIAADDASRLLGPDHPDTLTAAGRLAAALVTSGESAEAVTWAERAHAGLARIRGTADPVTIAAQVTLGTCLAAAGKAGDAVVVLDQAARLSDQAHGSGAPITLAAGDELAAALMAAGHRADAVRCAEHAAAGYARRFGEAHAVTLAARSRLAEAYQAGGELRDAVTEYGHILAAHQEARGADHPDTLAVRAALAGALAAAGDIVTALHHRLQACAGYERVLGADHPETLAARADLARAYSAAGQLGDAVTLLRDAIRRSEQVLSPGDPLTLALRDSLAGIGGVTR